MEKLSLRKKTKNKMQRSILSLAISAATLGFSAGALAQAIDGSVRGTVQGAGTNAIVEVENTARGTTRSNVIGADGEFRVDGLSPGSYQVRILQNGQVVDSLDVQVTLGGATRVTMGTNAGDIQEIVSLGRRMPPVDTGISESGLIINSEALLELPVNRDLTAVALLAPGTTRGDGRFGNLASFGGASIAENTSFINGLNTTNFRTGVGFSKVPFEFYETLQIKTGGYSAQYGRSTGGVMNAVTKSGSNDWDMGVNVYYNDAIATSPNTFASANHVNKKTSTTSDIYASGPIIPDRLFFYALYSDDSQEQRFAGIQSRRDYDFEVNEGFWGVKLDGYITPDHKLELTAFSDERTGIETSYLFNPTDFSRGSEIGDTLYEEGGTNWIASYTGSFGENLQVSVSHGENEANRTVAPATASIPAIYEAPDFIALGDWTSFTVSEGNDTREMSRIDFTWTGFNSHQIKAGIDREDNGAVESTQNSGGVYWLLDPNNQYFNCASEKCPSGGTARKRTYDVGGFFETSSYSYYLQDVWEVNEKLTLELGIRNETFENMNADGGVFVEVKDQWAPRLSAVYDPTGNGRSKYFASFGQYFLPIAANTNIRMAGNETYIQEYYDWNGSMDAQFVPTSLGPIYRTQIFGDGTVPDTRSVTDGNLEAMYQDEFILGYQHTLDSGIMLGIKGIYRKLGTTIEDVAIDAAVISYYNSNGSWTGDDPVEDVFGGFHQYVLTNPGADMSVYIPEQDEVINLTSAQLGYPKAKRTYEAIELTADVPFEGRWSTSLSYTWSRSEGNHEGYVKSDNAQDDAGITVNFDQPGLVDNSSGKLPNDRTHTFKAYGTYQFDNGIRLGANALVQSGRPINCFGVHPTDSFAADYGAASHFCAGKAVSRGSLGRTSTITNLDLSVQYDFNFANRDVLVSLDLFNVLNTERKIRVQEVGDTADGLPDADFGKITAYQSPRAIRLSARFNIF